MGKRCWRVYAGSWAQTLAPVSFFCGFESYRAAAMRAVSLIKRSKTTKNFTELLSPIVVEGPLGNVLWLYLDEQREIRAKPCRGMAKMILAARLLGEERA